MKSGRSRKSGFTTAEKYSDLPDYKQALRRARWGTARRILVFTASVTFLPTPAAIGVLRRRPDLVFKAEDSTMRADKNGGSI